MDFRHGSSSPAGSAVLWAPTPKLTLLLIAPLLAGTVEAMFATRSVSEIFAGEEAF